MKVRALIAIAESDDKQDPTAQVTLKQAFVSAGLPAEIEVYVGTKHVSYPNQALAQELLKAAK